MQHFGFILASYVASIVILGGIALWLVLDSRRQKQQLKALEQRGVRRRSAKSEEAEADQ